MTKGGDDGMTDHQKESVETVRQFTTHTITLAAALIAIVGAVFSGTEKSYVDTHLLGISLGALIATIFLGLLVYGTVISQLSRDRFNAWEARLRILSFLQLAGLVFAGVVFARFIVQNI